MGSLEDLWMPNLMSESSTWGYCPQYSLYSAHGRAHAWRLRGEYRMRAGHRIFSASLFRWPEPNLREKVSVKSPRFPWRNLTGLEPLPDYQNVNDIAQINNFASDILAIVVTAPIMSLGGMAKAYSKSALLSRVFLWPVCDRRSGDHWWPGFPYRFHAHAEKIDAVNRVMREKAHRSPGHKRFRDQGVRGAVSTRPTEI
jgi:hypothetical protein